MMPLRYLFVDMNSYFASVEQLFRPELRNRPIAVAPLRAETTCCIAASYEAKRYGVKTGTPVWQARQLCPGLRIVEARPDVYIRVHHRFLAAIDSVTPLLAVRSIDEVVCRLTGNEQHPDEARKMALQVKQAIATQVGPQLRCSIGIAPNQFLSKVASDMQKPDGLTLLESHELPQRLWELKLRDFPGIGARMEQRLLQRGIRTVQQLTELSLQQISQIWGSRVHGTAWWNLLRGEDLEPPPTRRQSLGHGHVLAPELRTSSGARMVLRQLLHKAAARLRRLEYCAGNLSVTCDFVGGPSWQKQVRMSVTDDTLLMLHGLWEMWDQRPPGTPLKVGVVLSNLIPKAQVTTSLFEPDRQGTRLSHALDQINQRFGPLSIQFGGLASEGNHTPMRIAFTSIPDLEDD